MDEYLRNSSIRKKDCEIVVIGVYDLLSADVVINAIDEAIYTSYRKVGEKPHIWVKSQNNLL